jgi:hypothetical protein
MYLGHFPVLVAETALLGRKAVHCFEHNRTVKIVVRLICHNIVKFQRFVVIQDI